MKIISLTIGGFGKLKNQSFTFKELTQILSENSTGKSTLANFIECMFYGIDAKNSSQRDYLPWENALFGGNLTFEANGKTYRVERSFGKRKQQDSFALFSEDGNPSLDFTDKLGEELFGLNKEAFHRVCFFDQSDYNGGQSYLSERLNALMSDSDEFNGFEKTEEKLSKKIRGYQNKLNHGLIPDVKEKIAETDRKIRELAPYKDTFFAYQDKLVSQRERKTQLSLKLAQTEKESEELLKKISSYENEAALKMLDETQAQTRKSLELLEKDFVFDGASEEQTGYYVEKCIALEKKISEYEKEKAAFYPQEQLALPSAEKIKEERLSYEKATAKKTVIPFILSALFFVCGVVCLALAFLKDLKPLLFVGATIIVACVITLSLAFSRQNEIKKLLRRAQDFLGSYGYAGFSASSAFDKIENDSINQLNQREIISKRNAYVCSLKNEIVAENGNIEGFLAAHCKKQGERISLLAEFKSAIIKRNELLNTLEKIKSDKLKYSSNPLLAEEKARYSKLNAVKENLKSEIEECESVLNNAAGELALCQQKTEKYDELTLKKAALKNELDTLEKELYITEKTLLYLQQAKKNLTDGYLEPVKKSLRKYAKTLINLDQVDCDENFKVTFSSSGITREFKNLSLGQRQLINFALRLGLVDALFPQEKPFIIIDDAFCPLDKENLALSSKMIKEISKTIQVIYLIPHSSRSLKNN